MAEKKKSSRATAGKEIYEDLTSAAMWGRLALLESLLENGADPNFPNGMGNTALHEAAYYGERECVSVLLTHKANVNAKGSGGKTPLHKAVTGILVQEPGPRHETEAKIHDNQMDIVRLLVARGAELNITDNSDATPRDLAMQYDFYECADLIDELAALSAKLAQERLREERLEDLLDACDSGDLDSVEELLGHLPEAVNEFLFDGENLLMRAVRNGNLQIVLSLLSRGARPVASHSTNLTALHIACQRGLTGIVVCLLNNLPALLAIDDSPKETSLHIAARNGHTDIMRSFLAIARQAEVVRAGDGSSQAIKPCLFGPEPVAMNESLPEMVIDVLAVSVEDRKTPLHEAAANGHVEIVQLVVDFLQESHATKRDSLINTLTMGGTPNKAISPASTPSRQEDPSPFGSPTHGKRQPAVPGIDMLTLKGCTPFHEAVKAGHFEVMRILLEAGADVNAFIRPSLDTKVNADLSALVYACLNRKPDIVRFLLQHNATDARLKALSRTLRKQFYEVVGLLLCFNGAVKPTPVSSRLPPPTEDTPLQLSISWNSKNLHFIHSDWLEMVLVEAPRPKNRVGVISQLDVSSNALSRLPIEVFRLPQLVQLDVSRNQISELPFLDELENGGWACDKLATIDASSNQLRCLPPCLFTLEGLKELNANCNRVDQVPSSVWTAPKLVKLHLNHNALPAFPTHCLVGGDSPLWAESLPSPSPVGSGGANIGSFGSTPPDGISPPDSGYRSDPKDLSTPLDPILESIGLPAASTPLPLQSLVGTAPRGNPSIIGNYPRGSPSVLERRTHTQAFVSRRFECFHDSNVEVEEFDDLDEEPTSEPIDVFCLEVLDLSHNKLTAVPGGLSCLAPRLQKLNLAHNLIRSLGPVSEYPPDLELLDASSNDLQSAVVYTGDARSLILCARKQISDSPHPRGSFIESTTASVFVYNKPCVHRLHKNLRKLSTLKLNSNQLVDLQLFRYVSRSRELTISVDESVQFKVRANTEAGGVARIGSKGDISRSVFVPRQVKRNDPIRKSDNSPLPRRPSEIVTAPTSSAHKTNGSNSSGSQDGSGAASPISPASALTPLYPQLSTLELSRNKLTNVPAHVHLMANLSCLVVSHNTAIDTLPLELSNLEHLWNMEYEGCPLTNPPAGDLDKFRLASDKLMYMRSLLHDAKPNESLKLMLVGFQRMGKSTLLSRLKEVRESATPLTTFTQRVTGEAPPTPARGKKRNDTLSTVGVDLGVWRYRKDLEPEFLKSVRKKPSKPLRCVTFYTWDFGGQEEYYVTHQCFLSTRSLYLVVWNVTQGEEAIAELGPWLHNIQARAPGSPVVIVGTHCDQLHGERERRKLELNNIIYQRYLVGRGPQALREMGLPKILDVLYVGCPLVGRPEGVAELRMALYDIAFSLNVPRSGMTALKTKLLEQPIPASFLLLEERVRELAGTCTSQQEPPVLRETVFREKTKDLIANPRELNQAVTFLHENGVLLHYATPALSHLYFVDPQWLCDMLAHVVTVPEVNRFIQRSDGPEAGILRTTVLSHVFKGNIFPQAHRKEYIELLGKFEVALILDRHRLLVPSMLPAKPHFTIHAFANVFPRPSLDDMLQNAPLTPLFSEGATTKDGGRKETENHSSEEFYRTGLLLRRFYFMTYVPSGFWPRLISRFLSSSHFAAIILRSLGFDEEQVRETSSQLVTGQLNGAVSLEWSYWKCGIELWYKGLSMLRVAEIVPDGIYQNCKPSPSIFNQSSTVPIEPAGDAVDLSFELSGLWMPVDMTPNRGIEILVPDTVSTAVLQREMTLQQEESTEEPSASCESCWMSAALLAQAVDYLDTLLEDWYPGLGARDGNRTVESVPYVNRVIPCPFCVNGATPHTVGSKALDSCMPTIAESSTESSNQSDEFPEAVKPVSSRARRPLFTDEGGGDQSDEATPPRRPATRKGSLADIHHMPPSREVKDVAPPLSPMGAPPKHSVGSECGLTLASRFGFMIETCILSSRKYEPLKCPAHPGHALPVRDLAPDLVFADLPSSYLLDPACVNQGEYIDHGSFGDIYHGAVYPTPNATDDEGREVAIKIDRVDSKKYDAESATKAYVEVRAEVSILRSLDHRHVIAFIGVVLRPLCFILEWAPCGSLSSMFQKYRKLDARISPSTLQQTALQVASGLAYLHEKRVVYYDLKSPNILVFRYPSAQESLDVTQPPLLPGTTPPSTELPLVYVKIADLGISRILTPGGVMGFKGSPGFMAPEILKYVGTEACTEKVDVFSYGMFLYEMISLHFPFEKQNLMHSQIERLVIEGERPPLQNRELNTPILYLDVMRWCWQQDYRSRPTAQQLQEVLANPAIPRLVDAISLHHTADVTCACVCTLPIEVVSSDPASLGGEVPMPHPHVARGDLQEELWLGTFAAGEEVVEEGGAENRAGVVVINFRGKTNFSTEYFPVCGSQLTAMCCVNHCVWLGSAEGQLFVLDATSRQQLLQRHLAVLPNQGLSAVIHLPDLRHVLVARQDGCLLLFDQDILEHKLPDNSHFDNHINSTQLPVRSVFKTPERLPLLTSISIKLPKTGKTMVWCGTSYEMCLVFDIAPSRIEYCRKLYSRSRYDTFEDHRITAIAAMPSGTEVYVWGVSQPSSVLYCWSALSERLLRTVNVEQFSPEPVTGLSITGTQLQVALTTSKMLLLDTVNDAVISSTELRGHVGETFTQLPLGGRILPRHWLPTIIGRSNAIDYYRELLGEEDIESILGTMVGRQCKLLVTVGRGFYGVAGQLVEPIMSQRDCEDTFILLWAVT